MFRVTVAPRVTALVAAFVLALSGASAFAASRTSSTSRSVMPASERFLGKDDNSRCKKNEDKKHKCKKKKKNGQGSENPPPGQGAPAGFRPGRVVELTYMGALRSVGPTPRLSTSLGRSRR